MSKRKILVFPQDCLLVIEDDKEVEIVCFSAMDSETGDIINTTMSTNWVFGWADIKGTLSEKGGKTSTMGKFSIRNYNRRFGEGNWECVNSTKAKAYELLEKLVLERLELPVEEVTKQVV